MNWFLVFLQQVFMKNLLLLFFSSLLVFLSCNTKKQSTLQIATAANMQYAMAELIAEFEKTNHLKCDLIVSSSGKLTAQIIEGAPYDIFISADMKYPNTLYKKGLTISKPEIYAYGTMVMWTNKLTSKPTLDILTSEEVKHIAIANPKTAPYGNAAVNYLKKVNLYEKLKSKFVYGESIAQTNQFIKTGAAEVGFTAKAVVLSKNLKNVGKYTELNSELYKPIAQGIVSIKNNNQNTENQKKFLNFIFSEKGREILHKFGYITVTR